MQSPQSPLLRVVEAAIYGLAEAVLMYLGFIYLPTLLIKSLVLGYSPGIVNTILSSAFEESGGVIFVLFCLNFAYYLIRKTPIRLLFILGENVTILYFLLKFLGNGVIRKTTSYSGYLVTFQVNMKGILIVLVVFAFLIPMIGNLISYVEAEENKVERSL